MYFILNNTPDYEGISFYLADGTYLRVGLDQSYYPNLSDHTLLDSRLIGFSAKFGYDSRTGCSAPSELGLYVDSTSCEEAVFTAPNPFTAMTVDVYTGATDSQT